MSKSWIRILTVAIIILALSFDSANSRANANVKDDLREYQSKASFTPAYAIVAHRVGNIVLAVNNNGTLGTGFSQSGNTDYFTGAKTPSCEYPKDSHIQYLFAAAFWIGAVVGRDTLVSVTADGWNFVREFAPDEGEFGRIKKRSITYPDQPEFEGAVSEEDYIMVYTDTSTEGVAADPTSGPHKPLDIEVTQRSFAWSYPYAEDFILFDYNIKNIGFNTLNKVYMGIYNDADVGAEGAQSIYLDDISGFIETVPTSFNGCNYLDTVNIAWVADNDGDPQAGMFTAASPTSATGIRIVRTPADTLDVSFNWWISASGVLDFGPREKSGVGRLKEEYRDFGTGGLGTPEGDPNKYYQMRNKEFDYDQVFSAKILPSDTLWQLPPQERAPDYADGYDTRFLLSFGPFDIRPGEVLPISFAYIGGENFHTDVDNLDNLPFFPETFYQHLNFDDFGENSAWASRVYDNPGVDTDGDLYFGKKRICCQDSTFVKVDTIVDENGDTTYVDNYIYELCDTMFYEGDGVPDFRGASPPPAPDFWLTPSIGSLKVRFNGRRSETTKDIFSGKIDFEGYRVYLGFDNRVSSFSLSASYDIDDYNKYIWNENLIPQPGFQLLSAPYKTDSLISHYSQFTPGFDPALYTRNSPYTHPNFADSIFYFLPQDYNASELGISTPIKKIYPNQPYPSNLNPDSARADELTEDGYLKYFEYEYEITDLLPTVSYWISVTAFDYGSPESGLKALESAVNAVSKNSFALSGSEDIAQKDLKVYTYPNPYRYDGNYRADGFEGRTDFDRPDDRVRAIHFVNLPNKCTISIFSLDGDLIRQIDHDKDASDPDAGHDTWDLITRNTQLVVSGLYYWTVEADDGETQIGKFAVIM